MMKRIGRTTLMAASVLAMALASVSQAQTVMRNSISVAQNSHQGVGVDVLAQEVEKRTNGH
jgi:TRAP-type C4-dicarboxylate transport system substrate-binding protein